LRAGVLYFRVRDLGSFSFFILPFLPASRNLAEFRAVAHDIFTFSPFYAGVPGTGQGACLSSFQFPSDHGTGKGRRIIVFFAVQE